jgi:flagellar biosynthetic protein FliR
MDWPQLRLDQILLFIFIFLRVGTILFFLPLFNSRHIPWQLKIGISLIISVSLFPFQDTTYYVGVRVDEPVSLTIAIAREVLLGMVIGFAGRVIFAAIQLSGQIMGFQMGFGIANILDPVWESQVSILSQWVNFLAILLFLSVNAHHWFIRAMIKSFELIPMGTASVTPNLTETVAQLTSNIFIISLKITAPILATILFINMALALVARSVPQMNVFIIGFPLQIAVGLFILTLIIPFLVGYIGGLWEGLGTDIWHLLSSMEI